MLADVKTAFLYGDARTSLYVELPPGDPLSASGRYVGKLERAMYGTRPDDLAGLSPADIAGHKKGVSTGDTRHSSLRTRG